MDLLQDLVHIDGVALLPSPSPHFAALAGVLGTAFLEPFLGAVLFWSGIVSPTESVDTEWMR